MAGEPRLEETPALFQNKTPLDTCQLAIQQTHLQSNVMEKIGFGRVKRFKVSNPKDVEHQIVSGEMPLNEAYRTAAHLNRIGRGRFYAYVETRHIDTFQVFPVRRTDRKGQIKEPIQFDNPKDFRPEWIFYTGEMDFKEVMSGDDSDYTPLQ